MSEELTPPELNWGRTHANAASRNSEANANYKHRDQMRKANSAVLVESSTICPFRWSVRNGYMCFYCKRPFLDPVSLRQHTSTEHTDDKVRPLIRKIIIESMLRVDVTRIDCKLCSERLPNLSELVDHLKRSHRKKFYDQVNEGVIPFRLTEDSFVCAVCGEAFRAFHSLNSHMNEHYANYYCETCGAHFISAQRLRSHRTNHETGRFECKLCEMVFDSYEKRHRHVGTFHSAGQFKCPRCPARFRSFTTRQSHLIKIHELHHLQQKCNVCDRPFVNKAHLTQHVRREHLKERNHRCDMCEDSFFTRSALQDHMIRHIGARVHVCEVCKKSYARKKTLVEHMRIHNDDRRFSCVECGTAFVQKYSLKSHMKTHHSR